MSSIAERTFTPADLLAMENGKCFELVAGRLVERRASRLSSWVGGEVSCVLRDFVNERKLGWVWPASMGYVCFPNEPNRLRRPNASFVSMARLRDGLTSEPYIDIPPDLAVDVVSPTDSADAMEERIVDYLAVGVALVWVVLPASRTAYAYHGDGSVIRLREHDDLSGENVLSGFRCRLRDVFPESPAGENGNGRT
jgi:Uma2 family endonuclease